MFAFAGLGATATADQTTPYQLQEVGVDEHLSEEVAADLTFTDHNGESVRLGDYFQDDKPVLLTLNYLSCETLCSVQLNGLLDGLKAFEWTAGEQFRIVTVSIDAREDAALAKAKRTSYLAALDRGADVDWAFLTGEEAQINALADAVGFRFTYDATTDQFAHPAVLTFLSKDRIISRYLYGIQYPARDLKFALIETSEGRVGSPVDKIILSCFRYDTTAGKYTATIFGIARLGGVLTVLALLIAGAIAWRRELLPQADGSPT
ncbi:MAG: SCO family protein [Myxococcota bacterium]